MAEGRPPRVGDQWELELLDAAQARLVPWGGQAPRSLTRAFGKFKLSAIPPGGPAPERVDLVPAGNNSSSDQLELPFVWEVEDG